MNVQHNIDFDTSLKFRTSSVFKSIELLFVVKGIYFKLLLRLQTICIFRLVKVVMWTRIDSIRVLWFPPWAPWGSHGCDRLRYPPDGLALYECLGHHPNMMLCCMQYWPFVAVRILQCVF